MSYFEYEIWRLFKCRIILIIVTVFNNRHIKTVVIYMIFCSGIFKKKYHPDGSIEKYKARLVAKGFTKKHNIYYFDTFSPVTRISYICVLLALTSIHKLVIHQMDVKKVFLNGELKEKIYMTQPEGCVLPGQKEKDANV